MLTKSPPELALASSRTVPHGLVEATVPGDAAGESATDPGPELGTLHNPFGRVAEQFRSLRSQLSLRLGAPLPSHGQVLAVVGAARGEGRSFIAANLAVSMAQRGGRVLLVDADLRRPRQHRLFGLRAAIGLASMLDGRADYRAVRVVSQLPSLHLLPAGAPPAHPLELVERPEFALVMRQLRLRYTHVIVDTPAAEDGPDAALVAANADAAVLVVQRHHSRMAALRRLLDSLQLAGTPVTGAVANAR